MSGSYETTDQTATSGLNPITNTSKIITPKQFRRDTSVRFRLRFVNPAGQLAQYLDENRHVYFRLNIVLVVQQDLQTLI